MEPSILIENSTLKDIDKIHDLHVKGAALQVSRGAIAWPLSTREALIQEIEENRQWKMLIDNKIACVWLTTVNDVQIWQERSKEPAVYLHRIATDPIFRGQQLLKKIIEWAKKYAIENGKKYVRLDTVGENKKLIEYYKKSGFDYLGMTSLKDTAGLPAHYNEDDVCLFQVAV